MSDQTNETLLDKSIQNFNLAKLILKNKNDDEAYVNYVAYHLQQSIELSLKHYLEINGIRYPFTHDIGDLNQLVGEDVFPYLYPWAGTITLMESKTRYIKDYRVSLKIVNDVFDIAERLISDVKSFEYSNEAISSDDLDDKQSISKDDLVKKLSKLNLKEKDLKTALEEFGINKSEIQKCLKESKSNYSH